MRSDAGDPYSAALIAGLLQPHLDGIAWTPAPAICPLDRDDAVAGDEVVKAQIVDLVWIESIEIDVVQGQRSTEGHRIVRPRFLAQGDCLPRRRATSRAPFSGTPARA